VRLRFRFWARSHRIEVPTRSRRREMWGLVLMGGAFCTAQGWTNAPLCVAREGVKENTGGEDHRREEPEVELVRCPGEDGDNELAGVR
jgi:hypothetical protein